MPSFKNASGHQWSYDADKRLGPPGGFGVKRDIEIMPYP